MLNKSFKSPKFYTFRDMSTKWTDILGISSTFKLEEFLSTEIEQLQWQTESLPVDQLSVQNATIILNVIF